MVARRHDAGKRSRRPGAGRPRKTPRRSTRPVDEEIIGEASRLFARQGVATTTMAEVADASGLQVSSIYYYFRSKEEILERIVGEVNRVPLDLLERALADHDDPAVRLHAFVRADGAALCRFPFDIIEVHGLARAATSGFEQYWAERRELETRVTDLIATGVRSSAFVEVDPSLAAVTILANDEAAQSWYRPRSDHLEVDATPRDPEAVGEFLADMALRALLVDPSRLDAIRLASGGD